MQRGKKYILEFLNQKKTLPALETLSTSEGPANDELIIHSLDGAFSIISFRRAVFFTRLSKKTDCE